MTPMIPAIPPLIIFGNSENCCLLVTTELVLKEDEDDGEVEEDDMLEVEMVARLLVDDVGDGVTPVVAVSLDFIADRLLAVAVADVYDVGHTL